MAVNNYVTFKVLEADENQYDCLVFLCLFLENLFLGAELFFVSGLLEGRVGKVGRPAAYTLLIPYQNTSYMVQSKLDLQG